jgi:hypothetical protein
MTRQSLIVVFVVLTVALNYGVFRRKMFNSTAQYYMFYDAGATSTTASIVGQYYMFYDAGATSTTASIVGQYYMFYDAGAISTTASIVGQYYLSSTIPMKMYFMP